MCACVCSCVQEPIFACPHEGCQKTHQVHPVSAWCFPATPTQPKVWFEEQLISIAIKTQLAAPYSSRALSDMVLQLQEEYALPGQPAPKRSVLRQLSKAALMWELVRERVNGLHRAGIAPIVEGGYIYCPCCYKQCGGVSGDCSLGMRRFREAAKASRDLPAFSIQSRFIPEAEVRAELQQLRESVPELELPQCVDFKADTSILSGKRVAYYDRLGLGCFCCRHEHVLIVSESHTYTVPYARP